ncbi:MAG: hypothetical protein KJ914_01985 [Gammaproteobacteria bacterium]|nr:hypothetical protein [Gammaproteobacteria bacterium]MBU1722751.1 hypothetical protein [Gammaproteobacteria bacterium]MBU2006074.1 hypothetical protein [Gammaproteobacteria bacterium]
MHLNPTSLRWLAALSIGLSTVTLADTKLTYTDSGFGPQERKTVIQIHGDKVRMEEADSGIYTLYDNGKKALYTVNSKTKQFIETTPDKIRERMTKVVEMQNQFKEEMKKQIASMPEDQRKVLEERMQQAEEAMKAPPPEMKMEKTERKETVSGLECGISTVKMADQAVRDVCIAGSDAMESSDHQMLITMFEYMDGIATESAKVQGVTPPAEGSAAVHKEGLALRIQALPQGPRSELSAIGKDALTDADFTVPADYAEFEPSAAPPPQAAPAPEAPAPAAQAGNPPTPAPIPAAPVAPTPAPAAK